MFPSIIEKARKIHFCQAINGTKNVQLDLPNILFLSVHATETQVIMLSKLKLEFM